MKKITPIFKKANNAIVLAFNNDFAKYAAVLIQSILNHSSESHCYDIIILHSFVSKENQTKLLSMVEDCENFSIRFITIDLENMDELYIERGISNLSPETYYRLLIGDLLSDEYKRAVYLDSDMVLECDIAQLFEENVDGVILGACRDITGICINYSPKGAERVAYQKSILGINNTDDYFISGTLLINLDVMRREVSSDTMMEMAFARNWRQHDQDIMNYICRDGKARIIDASWNVMADYGTNKYLPDSLFDEWIESERKPKIIHYGGSWKPWRMDTYRDGVFWKCAAETPFWQDVVIELIRNNGLIVVDADSEVLSADISELRQEIRNGVIIPRYSSVYKSLLDKEYFSAFAYSEDKLRKELLRKQAAEAEKTFAFRKERKKRTDLERTVGRLKKENKECKSENRRLTKKLDRIISSRSYKLARKIAGVARTLKKAKAIKK